MRKSRSPTNAARSSRTSARKELCARGPGGRGLHHCAEKSRGPPAPLFPEDPRSWGHKPHGSSPPESSARGEMPSWSHPNCDRSGADELSAPGAHRPTAVAWSWLCQSCRSWDLENPARVPDHTQPPAEVTDSASLRRRGPWRAWPCTGGGLCCWDSLRIASHCTVPEIALGKQNLLFLCG